MVTVIDFKAIKTEDDQFVSLQLQGDITMVQSKQSGKFYATAKQCWLASTFTEDVAQRMVGKEIPGVIKRVECESYEFVIPDTGEIIELSHRWEYAPDGDESSLNVQAPKVKTTSLAKAMKEAGFAENGVEVQA